jgi:hypothetical protein
MYNFFRGEKARGRIHPDIELCHVVLDAENDAKLAEARERASQEMAVKITP